MDLFRGAKLTPSTGQRTVICLGNFDGLHLGHQSLLDRVKNDARNSKALSLIYTFDPHPRQVLRPELNHKPIFSRADLEQQLMVRGAERLIIEPFTKEFSSLSAERFVIEHLLPLKPIEIVVGHDFRFGNSREGSLSILRDLGQKHGFVVEVVPAVEYHGRAVSSSWLRELLAMGAVEQMAPLLGRAYQIDGPVKSGAGRGHQLGIPTANISLAGRQSPKFGVYITECDVLGSLWPAITNVGVAPTFQDHHSEEVVETHIFDQTMNLRGQNLAVRFREFLRPELRFDGVESLLKQIQKDITRAKKYFEAVR
jgi:riboflavin kinase / FMN adenylyltransferase